VPLRLLQDELQRAGHLQHPRQEGRVRRRHGGVVGRRQHGAPPASSTPSPPPHLPFPLIRCPPGHQLPDRTHRVVSGDGTILVYDFTRHHPPAAGITAHYNFVRPDFTGAILCPDKDCADHKPWMVVSGYLGTDRCCAAVYSRGDVVCSDLANCYILWQTVHWYSSIGQSQRRGSEEPRMAE